MASVILALLVASTSWAIGVGDDKKGPSETVTFQPVVWDPFIPELYVKPAAGAEGDAKASLKMEKPPNELPGVRQAWKALKERFRFDDLGRSNEAGAEIISGWTRSETGFLVHSALAAGAGEKLVQQMIAEAPALLYAAVGIDFGGKLKADREASLLDKYFKAMHLTITAHEIEMPGGQFNLADIRGPSSRDPFLILINYDVEFNRAWKELGPGLTSTGAVDKDLPPWRAQKLVEVQLELEVEGRLNDAEEAERKKAMGAIRFAVLPPKSVNIDVLKRDSERK